jgi:hypothetical protein
MADRESGAYWIRDTGGDWVVAYWEGDPRVAEWYGFGDDRPIDPKWIAEIGDRVVRRSVTAEATLAGRLVDYDLTAPTKYLRFPGFEEWPAPEPITDAQKTGGKIVLWNAKPGTWFVGYWDATQSNWRPIYGTVAIPEASVTHWLPPPPDVRRVRTAGAITSAG